MEVGTLFSSGLIDPFIDPFLVISLALVGVALILVLLVTASTLAVHAAESLVDRRRVLSALVAAGTPVSVLRDSLRREAMLTCMPLSVGGVLLGALVAAVEGVVRTGAVIPTVNVTAPLLLVCGQMIATVGLTWAAIHLAILTVAPQLVRATAPANLRTE